MELTPVAKQFILHWGEMGTRWGINRTVAQIHALLFLSPPLNAEGIVATLGVARSNVSTSLHELQGWRSVRVIHKSRVFRSGDPAPASSASPATFASRGSPPQP